MDEAHIYGVCVSSSAKGFVLDMHYMVLDRLAYSNPKHRDAWVGAMVRWAESKGRVNFIKPETMKGGTTNPMLIQPLVPRWHRILNWLRQWIHR